MVKYIGPFSSNTSHNKKPIGKFDPNKHRIVDGQNKQDPKDLSTLDRVMQFGRGVATSAGDLVDTAGTLASAVGQQMNADVFEKVNPTFSTYTPHIGHDIEHAIDSSTQGRLKPTDTLGHIMTKAGNFSLPLPGSTIAATVARGIGGATAQELLKDFSIIPKFIPGAQIIEDVLKTTLGMSVSDLASKKISQAPSAIKNIAKEILEEGLPRTLDKIAARKVVNTFSNLEEGAIKNSKDVINAAREEGMQLPFDVSLQASAETTLDDFYLKKAFQNKVYKTVMKNADEGMIQKLETTLEEIHPGNVSPGEANAAAKHFLEAEKTSLKESARSLYDDAYASLKPNDTLKPTHMMQAVKDILGKIARGSKSKDQQEVYNRLLDIQKTYSYGRVSVRDLAHEKQSLNDTLKNPNYVGFKNLLNKVVHGINKDLETTTNKEFLTIYKKANDFHASEIAGRVQSDIANSLLNGQIPKEALAFMQSPSQIRELKKILGSSDNANKVFNALKKAKLQDILGSNLLDQNGDLLYGKFAHLVLDKIGNQRDLLKELLSPDAYERVLRLAKISRAFSRGGHIKTNTFAASEALSKDDNAIKKFIMHLFGHGKSLVSGTFKALTGLSALPDLSPTKMALSRFMNNPEILVEAENVLLGMKHNDIGRQKKAISKITSFLQASVATFAKN